MPSVNNVKILTGLYKLSLDELNTVRVNGEI